MFRLQTYGNDDRRVAEDAKELCGEPLIVKGIGTQFWQSL